MGTLKPGATYIYERDGETIYAREAGTTERFVVGKYSPVKEDPKDTDAEARED